MSKKESAFDGPEFKIREVTRYIVTRYHFGDGTSAVIGEFPNGFIADDVAQAMANAQGGRVVINGKLNYSPAKAAAM